MKDNHYLRCAKGQWSLPWTWLIVKSKHFGFARLLSSNTLDLIYFLDLRYLGLGGWPSPSTLGLICMSDSSYLEFG
jgi:hypothetical protein